MRTILMLAAMSVCGANAQPIAFEVSTIKPSEPSPESSVHNLVNTLSVKNMTLRDCILFAWHLQDYQLSGGPAWAASQGWTIVGKAGDWPAKMSSSAQAQQLRVMLQNLLKDRFQLVMREEEKPVNAYALTVAKGGFKLKPTEDMQGGTSTGRGKVQFLQMPIAKLAELLANRLGRPVVDRTGITGSYTGTLTWTPDDAVNPETQSGPSIFAAIQEQFGLKLEATKTPVTTYVIERAEKPNAN